MSRINGYERRGDGSYLRSADGAVFEDLKDVFEATVAQWKLSRSYIAQHSARLDAAKAGAKEQSAAYMAEMFPEAEVFAAMERIEKEQDAILRQIVLAQYAEDPETKFPGTNTRKTKDVVIKTTEMIVWALLNKPEWVVLSPDALKQIKGAFTDRMHPLAGTLPFDLVENVDVIGTVIKDTELLNGGKNVREEITE